MRKLLGPIIVAGAALLGTVLPTLADPNLPNVARHRHFIQTPGGQLVEVGPRFCDDPSLQHAFNQFHFNIHHSENPRGFPVDTLGPQHGAPGLHNHHGAELVPRPCSFQP